jgi:hypothetical protein
MRRLRGAFEESCERGANTSASTGVHLWVTCRRQVPAVSRAFVLPSQTRASPGFPPRNLNRKEEVTATMCCCLIRNQCGYTRTTQAVLGGNGSEPVTAGSIRYEMPALAGDSGS